MIVLMKPGRVATLIGLSLVLLPGCRSTTQPTSTALEPTSGTATDFFTGTLAPGTTQFYSFPVQQALNVKVTLTALLAPGTLNPVVAPLTLLIGTSADGKACTGTSANTVTVTPSLTSHLDLNLPAASYCVSITDPGNLSSDVDFAVRIKQTLGTPTEGIAGTESFSTNMYPGGTATRTFTVGSQSDVNISLSQINPPASLSFGMGVTKDLSECRFIQQTTTVRGSTGNLTVRADPGTYCVRVFDPGNLAERVTFTMSIQHQ